MNKALIAGVRLCVLCIFLAISAQTFAQSVQFKVELLGDGITYRVSMKPSVSWSAPQNTVLGAQATLLAPTGNFQVTNLVSLNGFWANAPKITAPSENPAFDYFVFYMQGSTAMPISAGVETPLFTFQRSGICTGAVELIHNGLDEFMPPNSQSLNVGNDFTTTGGGGSGNNLWASNYAGGSAICAGTNCFVKYRLTKTGSTWKVSMIPMVTWHNPNNTTSTQQITIKVPTGGFTVSNLTNLTPGANYINPSRFDHPTEAPTVDYLVFNLQNNGTTAIPYQQGIEVPLFSFQNSGNCGAGGNVSLMPTSGDPFAVPNSWPANVGQQLTTLGGGPDLPICLDSQNSTPCGAPAPPTCLVDYKLTALGGGKYQVSIIPNVTWPNPLNTTSTMQFSLKVPTGGFAVDNLTNLTGAQFALGSRYDHPAEAPGFDYLDFNLQNQGTTAISYQNGVEVALFTFENTGPCSGSDISLVKNNDPFFPPNGSNANIGQQLSTNGGGADVPICINGTGSVPCETVCRVEYKISSLGGGKYQFSIIPHISWANPLNTTSTMQFSLKVPTGGFAVDNLTNLTGAQFALSSRYDHPAEAPGFDYLDFNLQNQGTTAISYQNGVEVALFTFENTGPCSGSDISLVQNNDPFFPPNGSNANIGQQLSTNGGGADVPICISGTGSVACETVCRVDYKISSLGGGKFQFSIIPHISWPNPLNTTSTMQASLRVPTGGFAVANVTNLTGAQFALSSRYDHPVEAPGFDYLDFNLQNQGTTAISYQNGVEVALFTFENTGPCSGSDISLVKKNDPFFPPNGSSANIGQQLSTNGGGADVPICISGTGSAACETVCRVDYELLALGGGKYQVSMIPRITWNAPDNTTATMQVSLRAPTGGLEVANLTNLVAGAAFAQTSRYDHPSENAGFDYLDFNLQNNGTTTLSYQNGVKVPLFTFDNVGECTGGNISLVQNNDPFFPPNSQSANVGQQLTTAGFGSNDVPICIAGTGAAACEAACLVEYKLTALGNGTYLVSMIPNVTWNAPDNITSTAQVTIKVPTGGFVVDNLTSLVPGAAFSETSRFDHPSPAAPTFDYISFTLQNMGTSALSYQNGVEVGLFTFQNGGSCTGNTIYLIDENDPFFPPNAQNANVGQQLTTLGYGNNDVPICISGTGSAPCSVPVSGCLVNLKLEPISGCKYQVSMIPQVTWNSPQDVTKKAKLTIRVPHGCFSMTNLTSLHFGGSFSIAQTVLAPPDNPDFDYYCLNMTTIPTVALGYQAGVAVPLLTFENGGSCCGLDSVRIMNMADPMADGNSLNINLDPHWETAGTGPSGTTPCLVGTGAVPCQSAGSANLLPASVDICPGVGVQLSPTAGFATYLWSPGTGLSCTVCQNPTATPAVTTTYSLTASTANGCATIDQITVNVKTVPVISSVSATNPATCGVNNGSIVVTATGSNLEYSINNGYAWQASNSFPGLAPGTYEVVIRSTATGCPVNYPSNPVTLTAPNAPTILSVTPSNPTNCGTANGSIVINASGSNLLYSINGGATYFANNTFSGLAAGTWNIRVKNSVSNCVSSAAPEILTGPTAPTVPTATATATTDCSISDGTLTITASGGTPPLSYSIDNGTTWQTSNIFTGLAAGSYPIRVRNANGSCETAGTATTVAAPAMPNITAVTPTQPTTCNAVNGSLTISASGGVGQLEYSIDGINWQTANLFPGLAAGSYTVFVRNQDNTCPKAWPANPVILAPTNAPTIGSLTPQNVTSCTTNNGSIQVNASGGTPPLEYSLNGTTWQTSNLFQNLPAGTYTAFVRNGADDSCEKQFSGTVTLTAPAPPVLNSATGQNPTSCTVNNGTITVSASGSNLQFSINNGGTWQAGGSFAGLGDGIYTVLVRNSVSLCLSNSQTVTLTAPAGPSILQVTASPTTDCGTANGQLVIDATGGQAPLEFSINNGTTWQTSNIFTGLAAGSYPISVRNSNGSCTVSAAQPTAVNTPPQPNLSAVVGTAPTGCATNDGSISITATGGIAPLEYSIDGNDWFTAPVFSGLAAGSYTVWVRNQDNTCPKAWPANPVVLNAPAQPTIVSATPTNPGCSNNDGSIVISANGVPPGGIQYSIDNVGWQASPNFTGLPAGSYTVRVRNANGSCANAFANAVVLTTPALPVVNSITPANPTTCSTPNGSISISATGANLQYSINGGTTWQNGSVFNGLMAGVYTIVVRNSVTLCQSSPSQMVNLTAPASATFTSVNATPTTDCGLANGTITVAATGGQGPLEFSINNINWQTGLTFSGLAAGSYTVQVRNFNSTCPVQYPQPVVVGSPAAPVINSFTQVNPGCISNDGSITISANGGTAPLQYSIDNVGWQASPVFSNLPAGSYTIRVRNANGSCPSVFANAVVLTTPVLPVVNSVSPTNPTTCTLTDGTISISATGQNLQYSINGGSTWQNSPNFTGLAAGNYSVVVRNSVSLCQSSPAQAVTLTAPAAATFSSVNATPTTDCNLNNGTITVAATGGVGPLEFSLNNTTWQTSGTFSGLAAGSYTVFVRNFNGTCTVQFASPVVVGSPAQPSILTATATQPGCSNNDGSITISANGGIAPLEYSINNVNWQTSPIFSNLAAGSYTVRVRNANGSCANPFASPVVLTAPAGSPVVILITPTNSTNCAVSDGSITISASGQNLQYSINGGTSFQNSNIFTGLAAGNYSILVRNSVTLCQSSPAQPVTLTAPAMANFTSANASPTTDCGLNNGSITVAATGGLAPLEFSINNTTWQTGGTFSGLAPGSYTVWVRNFNGTCAVQFASPVVVNAPASPSILSATATNPGCANTGGSITISATGGTAPLEYSIDNINWQTSAVFSNLGAGSYTVRVRNANGSCANAFANAVVLTAPTAPVLISATPTNPSGCIDAANGSITILATGQNLEYSINGGATWSASSVFNNLPGDVYTVVVRNSVSGCLSASQQVTLLTPQSPTILSATVTPSGNCNLATGTITVVGTGGTAPLEYSLDNLNWQSATTFSNVAPGSYTIFVRNSNGSCVTAYPTPVVISGNGQPVIISVSSQNPGCTNNDGTISIVASGGAAPYEFSLNGTVWQLSSQFTGLAAGSYSVFVRNQGAACSNNYGGQVVLTGAAAPAILSVVAIQPAGCGVSNGQITITATGQNLQFTINGGYAWQSSNTFAGLTSGTYIIMVRNGLVLCQSNAQIIVLNAPTAPAINAIQVTATSDCGLSDGSIFATATGGTAPYQFSRDGGATWQANGLFTGLAAGTYSIMVRNSGGTCPTVYAQPITVQGATQPFLTSILAQQPTCSGNDGSISATAAVPTGVGTYQFSINGTVWQTSNVFSGLSAGTYTVYVRNNNGTCSNPYFTPITLTGGSTPAISSVLPVNPAGCGVNNGSITVSATGSNLQFSINGGASWQSSNLFSNLAAGTYSVLVRNLVGLCVSPIQTTTLTAPTAPTILSATASASNDCGVPSGAITVSATGGTPPLQYSLDGTNWQTGSTFTGLSAGYHTVFVRNSGGTCPIQLSQPVQVSTINQPIVISVIGQQPGCAGNDGVLTIYATGGTAPYQYSINGTSWQFSNQFSGLAPGSYTAFVRNNGSPCSNTFPNLLTLAMPDAPMVVAITPQNPTGCGTNNGSITISASGANLQFSINGGISWQSSNVFSGLAAGTYSVLARSSVSFCQTAAQIRTLVAPTGATILSATATNPATCATSTGSIQVNATGGQAPLQYSINGGVNWQTNPLFANLAAGTYSILVRNSDGSCVVPMAAPVVLTSPAPVSIVSILAFNPDCSGNNGSIFVQGAGGAVPLEFSINNGATWQSSGFFGGLPGGNYAILVRNNNGSCQTASPINLTLSASGAPMILAVTPTNPTGCGLSNGQISVNATGVNIQYSLDGINWQAASVFQNLAAGTYLVRTRNSVTSCQSTPAATTLTAPTAPTILNVVGVSPTDCNLNFGTITVTATGGQVPLEYSINGVNWQTNPVFAAVPAGSYTVQVRNFNGLCPQTWPAAVVISTQTAILITNINTVQPTCAAPNAGSIFITASGNGPLEYSLDGLLWQANNSFNNLPAGGYLVRVRYQTGGLCVTTASSPTVLTAPGQPSILSATPTAVTDCGLTNGSITVVATGGNAPLQYSINGGVNWQTSPVFGNLPAGSFTILVANSNLTCPASSNLTTVSGPTAATILNVAATNPTSCATNNGSISITANGGQAPLEYSINGGASWTTNPVFTGLAPGTYSIQVRNSNGFCVVSWPNQVAISGAGNIVINQVLSQNPNDCGQPSGDITILATGSPAPLRYSNDNGASWQAGYYFSNLPAGTYQILVADANGNCPTAAPPVVLTNKPSATILSAVPTAATACGTSTGSITVVATGGISPLSYSIDNGLSWQASSLFSNLAAGFYVVKVRNADGSCIQTMNALLEISEPPAPIVGSVAPVNPTACGLSNGSITVNATGAGVLQYSLDGLSWQSSPVFPNLGAGSYFIHVRSAANVNCTSPYGLNPVILLADPNGPKVISYDVTQVTDCGLTDGSINLTVGGGVAPLQISINGGTSFGTNTSFTGLAPGSYSVVVRNADGSCPSVLPVFTLVAPTFPVINGSTATATTDCSTANGEILIIASGGTGVREFSLNGIDWQSSGLFKGLLPGSYTPRVRNFNGGNCLVVGSPLTVGAPTNPTISAVPVVPPTACGATNGSLTIQASGGTGPLQYSIDGIYWQASNSFSNLSAGTFTVFVRNNNGSCPTPWGGGAVMLTPGPQSPVINSVTKTNVTDCGLTNGTITVNATGGTAPLRYSKDGGTIWQTSNQFLNLPAGSYDIVVSNADGSCPTIYPPVQITAPTAPQILQVNLKKPVDCKIHNAVITILAIGSGPLQYSIDGGATWHSNNVFSNLGPGAYNVFVRNADGTCPVEAADNPYISCEFDLALRKVVAPGQSSSVHIGDDVKFRIWVYNQGFTTAKNIQVTDYLPVGTVLSATSNAAWTTTTVGGLTQISTIIPGPLALGDSAFVDISVRIIYGQDGATLINRAEISSATDLDGNVKTDVDSKPDATNGNDNEIDNVITDQGPNDEDDEDPAPITLLPTDPIGYIYCDKTGKIVPGGKIKLVSAPAGGSIFFGINMAGDTLDGRNGRYQFYTNGQPGTYNFTWMHPNGYPLSPTCLPQPGAITPGPLDGTGIDKDGLPDGLLTLGSNIGAGDSLLNHSCGFNPYWLSLNVVLGDQTVITENNIPVQCVFIGSFVCEDTNGDGLPTPGEPRLDGATVQLFNCSNMVTPIATTTTASGGKYRFDGLVAGDYKMRFIPPGNYRLALTAGGQPLNVDLAGFSACISLDFGDCDTSKIVCMTACPQVTVSANATICSGESTQLFASYPAGTISWSPVNGSLSCTNCANPTASPTVTTSYIAAVQDGFTCLSKDTVVITVVTPPAANFTVNPSNPAGCNTSNGSITVNSAQAGLEFSINNGGSWQSSNVFLGLAAGSYQVQIRFVGTTCATAYSANPIMLSPAGAPQITNVVAVQPTNCTSPNGSITISASGTNLEFSINGGLNWQPSNVFSALGAGSFDIRVRSTTNPTCVVSWPTITMILAQPQILNVLVSSNCNTAGQNSITVQATGGQSPLEYSIDGGLNWQTNNLFSNLAPGFYNVQVRNANGSCAVNYGANPVGICVFDLALKKTLSAGQSSLILLGDTIDFDITIYNQGVISAKNIAVVDYLPAGMAVVAGQGWTMVGASQMATTTFAGPLAPGQSAVIQLKARLVFGGPGTMLKNVAEIKDAEDLNGNHPPDFDSQPDMISGNDSEIDNVTDNGGGDEDDSDFAEVMLDQFDPEGYIYCDKTGKLITGGNLFLMTGPAGGQIFFATDANGELLDGRTGMYQLFTNGVSGVYELGYTHPNGYPLSVNCAPQGGTFNPAGNDGNPLYDKDGLANGIIHLGQGGISNGVLTNHGCAANPYFLKFYLNPNETTLISNNNLPISCGLVGGRICLDSNGDGLPQSNEPGVGNISISLFDCSNPQNLLLLTTVLTNGTGNYSFDGLAEGSYQIQINAPTGYTIGGPGFDATGLSPCFPVAFTTCDTTKSACFSLCPTISQVTTVNPSCPTSNGVIIISAQCAASMMFSIDGGLTWQLSNIFTDLPPGTYTIKVSNGSCIVDWTVIITLDCQGGGATTGNLSGHAWKDCGATTGILETGESPLPNITVSLSGNGQNLTTTTDLSGNYTFTGVPTGSYSIQFGEPTGLDFTTQNVGSDESKDSDVGSTGSATVVILSGQTVSSFNAGYLDVQPPVIAFNHPFLIGKTDGDTIFMECSSLQIFNVNNATGSDNCDNNVQIDFVEAPIQSFPNCSNGFLVIMHCGWIATDDCGNSTAINLVMAVRDTTPPNLLGLPANITLNANDPVPPAANVKAFDFCDALPTLVFTENTVASACGSVIHRTWTATDDCGNSTVFEQTITIGGGALSVSVAMNSPASCGLSNGSATLSPVNLTYSWSDGGSGFTRNGLAAGVYSVTASSGAGCTATISLTILMNGDAVSIQIGNVAPATCAGNDGSASLTSQAGVTFAWSDGGSGATRANLPPGNYGVTASNSAGCTATTTVLIGFDNSAQVSVATISPATCAGNDGTATLAPAYFNFAWSDGGTGASRSNLAAGNYSITATSAGGCADTISLQIGQQNNLAIILASQTNATCASNDGTASFTPATLNFAWSDGGTGAARTNLVPGIYGVTASNSTGCTATGSVTILLDCPGCVTPIFENTTLTAATCGENNGSAWVFVQGNESAFEWEWIPNTGTTTGSGNGKTDLLPGTYLVVVRPIGDTCELKIPVTILNDTTGCVAPPSGPNFTGMPDGLTFYNCKKSDYGPCIDIPFDDFLKAYRVRLNGVEQTGLARECDVHHFTYYHLDLLTSTQAMGPFKIDKWLVGGQVFTGDFADFQGLVALMNAKNPAGNWQFDPVQMTVRGEAAYALYGNLEIREVPTNSLLILEKFSETQKRGTAIDLPDGSFSLIVEHKGSGIADTVSMLLHCLSPDTIRIIMEPQTEQLVALDLSELLGQVSQLKIAKTNIIGDVIEVLNNPQMPEGLVIMARKNGLEQSLLLLIDDAGVQDTTWLEVRVLPKDVPADTLIVFNAFSPNNDGKNDHFIIQYLENYPGSELQIFNRWGERVFKSDDYQNDWDGRSNDRDVPNGIYFFVLEVSDGRERISGWIDLWR